MGDGGVEVGCRDGFDRGSGAGLLSLAVFFAVVQVPVELSLAVGTSRDRGVKNVVSSDGGGGQTGEALICLGTSGAKRIFDLEAAQTAVDVEACVARLAGGWLE